MTTVTVNGESQDLEGPTTVADLVALVGAGPKGVAVALNEEVVARSRWAATPIRAGDRIEVLTAAQGG